MEETLSRSHIPSTTKTQHGVSGNLVFPLVFTFSIKHFRAEWGSWPFARERCWHRVEYFKDVCVPLRTEAFFSLFFLEKLRQTFLEKWFSFCSSDFSPYRLWGANWCSSACVLVNPHSQCEMLNILQAEQIFLAASMTKDVSLYCIWINKWNRNIE